MHPMFHVNYLWPHYGLAPPLPPAPVPHDDVAAGECEIKDILYSHMGYFEPEYLVKWLRYLVFEST